MRQVRQHVGDGRTAKVVIRYRHSDSRAIRHFGQVTGTVKLRLNPLRGIVFFPNIQLKKNYRRIPSSFMNEKKTRSYKYGYMPP